MKKLKSIDIFSSCLKAPPIGGVLFFGVSMDTIEAKKNLNALCNEIEKLQNLSRSLMTAKEMLDIDAKIKRHKDQVKNIRSNLHA
ncbi:hypothetical protein C3415_13410 [Acinetobacter baumannii]|nr:hypothetical protein [Acinetobacter baumannii]MBV6573477.1 hypothetical protein [Acinetobacter baumannii]OFD28028.1 hypothetical protein A1D05_05945 [Acinetobacter baumannii]OFD28379.1 hypothetical protein A1D07_06340 [Acinetobacter baumannii]OFD34825.1 hypothetical protein A1D08_06310 [Acinetobacter baumannii]